MAEYQIIEKEQLFREIEETPTEYLPALLHIIRLYRQSVTLKPADLSFRQGWREALRGETLPVEELWTATLRRIIEEEGNKGSWADFEAFLAAVPDVEPEEDDRLDSID